MVISRRVPEAKKKRRRSSPHSLSDGNLDADAMHRRSVVVSSSLRCSRFCIYYVVQYRAWTKHSWETPCKGRVLHGTHMIYDLAAGCCALLGWESPECGVQVENYTTMYELDAGRRALGRCSQSAASRSEIIRFGGRSILWAPRRTSSWCDSARTRRLKTHRLL